MVSGKACRGRFVELLVQEEPKPETKTQPEANATGKPEDMDAEPSQAAPETSTDEPMEH